MASLSPMQMRRVSRIAFRSENSAVITSLAHPHFVSASHLISASRLISASHLISAAFHILLWPQCRTRATRHRPSTCCCASSSSPPRARTSQPSSTFSTATARVRSTSTNSATWCTSRGSSCRRRPSSGGSRPSTPTDLASSRLRSSGGAPSRVAGSARCCGVVV